jgi:uncharacterized membrane protein
VTTTARQATSGSAAALGGRRRNRLDWLLLRWQARLDAQWVDRVGPWVAATGLFIVYVSIALARASRLDAGDDLARHLQAAWHLAGGRAPVTTVGEQGNLFADRFPILFVPVAAVTRLLPAMPTLLAAQAGALALGILPLWQLARKVALLRVGATTALCLAYALHPAVIDLDLADFHPAAMAMAPLLTAAYYAERRRWGRFAVASVLTVGFSSELGLVIATMGVLLLLERERRAGLRATVLGLAWTFGTLLLIQAPIGTTGLVGPGAFDSYGASFLDVIIAMVRNPFRPLGDLLVQENVDLVIWILAPLLFLPVLAVRRLIPAIPLTALYLIADVPVRGPDGGARTMPLVAFSFVAAAFALARLGRRNVERVVVDRRLLALLVSASIGTWLIGSALSPYEEPLRQTGEREEARRQAIDLLPPVVPIRVPEAMSVPVAERDTILLTPVEVATGDDVVDTDDTDAVADPLDPTELTRGVDALVLDETDYPSLDPVEAYDLRRAIEAQGMAQLSRKDGIAVFVRILDEGVQVVD